MKYFLLSFLVINIASAAELDDRGWLKINCHSDNRLSVFSLSVSSDELGGINQIVKTEISGELKRVLESDSTIGDPLVSLIKRKGNSFEVFIRFENGLVWDTYLKMKLVYSPKGYRNSIEIIGDEGEYLKETAQYQCLIGNHDIVYLQTENYK